MSLDVAMDAPLCILVMCAWSFIVAAVETLGQAKTPLANAKSVSPGSSDGALQQTFAACVGAQEQDNTALHATTNAARSVLALHAAEQTACSFIAKHATT